MTQPDDLTRLSDQLIARTGNSRTPDFDRAVTVIHREWKTIIFINFWQIINPIFLLLSGATDSNVVKIITFINSNNATMFSAFHRFLVLELNSDSSKTPNQLSEKPLARKYFFDGPFSDSRYPRWVKPGANHFFFCFGSENYFILDADWSILLKLCFLLFMRKI